MDIVALILTSFGKYADKKIGFSPGINIVYGENESGKSTVHKFIEAMFFGFYKDHKSRRTYSDDYEKYLPLYSSTYEGSLIYNDGDRVIRIDRNLQKGKDKVVLYDERTGEDLSREFYYDPVSRTYMPFEPNAMNRRVYANTVSISQLGSRTSKDLAEELKDRLANFGESKGELSVRNALKRLNNQYYDLGTEKRKDTPIYELRRKIDQLLEERDQAEKAKESIESQIEELAQLEKKSERVSADQEKIKRQILATESYEALSKVKSYQAKLQENDDLLRELSTIDDGKRVSEEDYHIILQKQATTKALQNSVEELTERREDAKAYVKGKGFHGTSNGENSQNKIILFLMIILSAFGLIAGIAVHPAFYGLTFVCVVILIILSRGERSSHEEDHHQDVQKHGQWDEDIGEVNRKIAIEQEGIQVLLKKNHVATVEDFDAHLQKLKRTKNLERQLESSSELLETMIPRKDLDKWKKKAETFEQYAKYKVDEDLDTLLKKKGDVEEEARRLDLAKSKLKGSIEGISDPLTRLADGERDIAYYTRKLDKLKERQYSLKLAMDTIQRLSDSIQNDMAPELNRLLETTVEDITGKYNVVKVSKDLDIKVEDPIHHQYVDVSKLSSGTIDQIYFAFRMGIGKWMGHSQFPLLLDETFIQYDENRLHNTLEHIVKNRGGKQVILFTSQKREIQVMNELTDDFRIIHL